MPNVDNPRKVFNFKVEIEGLDQFEVQEFKLPDIEIEKTSHGDGNKTVHTPGMIKVGEAELKKLRDLPNSDKWAIDWLYQAQNPSTGSGGLPSTIKKTVIIRELSTDGITTANKWTLYGCWPSKISMSNFTKGSSDNIIETVTLCVDTVEVSA